MEKGHVGSVLAKLECKIRMDQRKEHLLNPVIRRTMIFDTHLDEDCNISDCSSSSSDRTSETFSTISTISSNDTSFASSNRTAMEKPPLPPKPSKAVLKQAAEILTKKPQSSNKSMETSTTSSSTSTLIEEEEEEEKEKERDHDAFDVNIDDNDDDDDSFEERCFDGNHNDDSTFDVALTGQTGHNRKVSVIFGDAQTHNAVMREMIDKGILKRQGNTKLIEKSYDQNGNFDGIPPDIGKIRPPPRKGRVQAKNEECEQITEEGNESLIESLKNETRVDSGYQTNSVLSETSDYSECSGESAEEIRLRKLKKAAEEFLTVERNFTSVLNILCEVFPVYLETYSSKMNTSLFPNGHPEVLFSLKQGLQPVLLTHRALLDAFTETMQNWNAEHPGISKVLLHYADYLKHCIKFLQEKKNISNALLALSDENTNFRSFVRQFETEFFKGLKFTSELDCIHQNVVRYKLLLCKYMEFLPESGKERDEATDALKKITEVNAAVNDTVASKETGELMLCLYKRLPGINFDLLQPGRKLIRQGPVRKQCRKEVQSRHLILFNDRLLICRQVLGSDLFDTDNLYDIAAERMQICYEQHEDYETSFTVNSPQKSATFIASDKRERDFWVRDLERAKIDRLEWIRQQNLIHRKQRAPASFFLTVPTICSAPAATSSSIMTTKTIAKSTTEKINNTSSIYGGSDGKLEPNWIADRLTTKCMMESCPVKFSAVKRRHHCRECGYIICGRCMGHAPREHHQYEAAIVCPECYANIYAKFRRNELYPKQMIKFDYIGTDGRKVYRIRDKSGTFVNYRKIFKPPKSGNLKRLQLPMLTGRVCGNVHVQNENSKKYEVKWASILDSAVLQYFNALYDEIPYWTQVILGCELTCTEEGDWHLFQLFHKNQFVADKEPQSRLLTAFRVTNSKSADKWKTALDQALSGDTLS